MSDLHTAIMNIPAKGPGLGGWKADCTQTAYRMGHRDARHAAAELASEFAASHQRLKEALAELIACKELRFAWLTMRSDPYHIMQAEYMEAELDRREPAVWDAAVAALKDAP